MIEISENHLRTEANDAIIKWFGGSKEGASYSVENGAGFAAANPSRTQKKRMDDVIASEKDEVCQDFL